MYSSIESHQIKADRNSYKPNFIRFLIFISVLCVLRIGLPLWYIQFYNTFFKEMVEWSSSDLPTNRNSKYFFSRVPHLKILINGKHYWRNPHALSTNNLVDVYGKTSGTHLRVYFQVMHEKWLTRIHFFLIVTRYWSSVSCWLLWSWKTFSY